MIPGFYAPRWLGRPHPARAKSPPRSALAVARNFMQRRVQAGSRTLRARCCLGPMVPPTPHWGCSSQAMFLRLSATRRYPVGGDGDALPAMRLAIDGSLIVEVARRGLGDKIWPDHGKFSGGHVT